MVDAARRRPPPGRHPRRAAAAMASAVRNAVPEGVRLPSWY
jgi:hypothetical protein